MDKQTYRINGHITGTGRVNKNSRRFSYQGADLIAVPSCRPLSTRQARERAAYARGARVMREACWERAACVEASLRDEAYAAADFASSLFLRARSAQASVLVCHVAGTSLPTFTHREDK